MNRSQRECAAGGFVHIFNDITAGSNTVPCAAGSPNCATEGTDPIGVLTGYTAGVGYDLTTGLGSVNAANW
jgi:hypothetical protein